MELIPHNDDNYLSSIDFDILSDNDEFDGDELKENKICQN